MRRGFTLVLLLTALVLALPARAETFRNPVRIVTGVDPNDVNIVDLNGDGRPDILWTAWGPVLGAPAVVHTLLAQADGSFAVGPILTLPTNVTTYCRPGDVTGDGRPDLVCPYTNEFDASLLTFPGNGDGSFGSPVTTVLPSSESNDVYWGPVLHPLVDINGDGRADALIVDAYTGTGFILTGNADGSFKLTSTRFGAGGLPQYLDINGDGHIDLLFPSNNQILLGDGTGRFSGISAGFGVAGTCVYGHVSGEANISAVCGQALTSDGDIIGGTQLVIFHGNGDGTFNPNPIKTITYGDHTNEYNGFGTFLSPLAVADFNGDGIPDIVAEAGDGLTVLLGEPGLNFGYPVHYATGYVSGSSVSGSIAEFAMQFGDINGDGLPDLVSSGPNGVYLNYGREDGSFDTAKAYEVTQVIGYHTAADFNEDGIPDIAATGDQAIELSLGNGDGTFQFRTPLPRGIADFSTPLSATNAHILHGDFNGDHHQDIIAIGSSSIYQYDNYVLFGHGDGSFTTPALVVNSSQTYPMYNWSTVFDINGDGRDDILSTDLGDLYFAISQGDGSFTTVTTKLPVDYSPDDGAAQSIPVLADFDGDGKAEAVVGTGTSVYVLKGHANGLFDSPGVKLTTPAYMGVPTEGAIALAAGDFDGDGHQDIALLVAAGISLVPPTNGYYGALFVYYGDGKGHFSTPLAVTAFNRYYTGMQAADLNKDGLDDLVLKTSGSLGGGYAVGVIHSLRGRTFGPEINYYAGTGLADLSIIDLNHDGFPDLVFGNGDFNIRASSVTVLMNLGNTAQVAGTLRASPEPSITGQPFQLIATLAAPDHSALSGDVSFSIDGIAAGSASLASNTATLPVSTILAAGVHTIRADWPGNSTYGTVSLAADHQVVAGYPTSTSIVSSRNPAPFGASVVFTISVQSTSGIPPGSITLTDGSTLLDSIRLADGTATYSTSTLAPGTHTITATYVPDTGWAPSSGSLTEEIDRIDAAATFTARPNPVYAFQKVEMTARLQASGPTPTGSVTFDENFNGLGTQMLTNGSATLTTSFSAAGSYILSGQYSGDQNYNSSGLPLLSETVLINTTTTRLSVLISPSIAFQPTTFKATVSSSTTPTLSAGGSVSFYDGNLTLGNAKLVNGIAALSTTSLNAGAHAITAAYAGDLAFGPSSSDILTLPVQRAPSTVRLASTINPVRQGISVSFIATIAGAPVPGGTVAFFDGGTQLGSPATVNATGTATLATNSLIVGTHAITAAYSGDSNLLPGTSGRLEQVILFPGDFSINVTPGSASLYTGESTTFEVAVTATDGFNQALAFSCANLPTAMSCAFTPASLTSGQGEAVLTLQTTAPQRTSSALRAGSGTALLASIVLIFLPGRRGRAFKNSVLSLCLIAITLAGLGCSNVHPVAGGTPPGTYHITVTATTTSAPNLSHATMVTVVVKSLF
jgi:hypothetical protein